MTMSRSLTPSPTQPSPNPEIKGGGGWGDRGGDSEESKHRYFRIT